MGVQIYCSAECRVEATERRPPRPAQTCVECKTTFRPDSSHQKRCRRCIDANPLPPGQRPDPKWRDAVCPACALPFQKGTAAQVYCSKTCREKLPERKRRCKRCSREFTPHANKQYCGEPCVAPSVAKLERKGKATRACEGCGGEFESCGAQHRFCSPSCNPREASKPRPTKPKETRLCACGATWTPSAPSVQTTQCPDCRETDREAHVYAQQQSWRRAVRRRAEGKCEDCGATEQQTGAYHHAHHIVPRCEGGQHTLANGKLLCVNCHDAAHGGGALGATLLVAAKADVAIIDQIAERVVQLLKEESLA